jgi:hypothetical protein
MMRIPPSFRVLTFNATVENLVDTFAGDEHERRIIEACSCSIDDIALWKELDEIPLQSKQSVERKHHALYSSRRAWDGNSSGDEALLATRYRRDWGNKTILKNKTLNSAGLPRHLLVTLQW